MNYTDPTGHCSANANQSTDQCWLTYARVGTKIKLSYTVAGLDQWDTSGLSNLESWLDKGVKFTSNDYIDTKGNMHKSGQWNADSLLDVTSALNRSMAFAGASFEKITGMASRGISFNYLIGSGIGDLTQQDKGIVHLFLTGKSVEFAVEVALHGIGHTIDYVMRGKSRMYSDGPAWGTGSGSASVYGNSNRGEDFAETYVWMVENRSGGNGFQNNGKQTFTPSKSRQTAIRGLLVSSNP